MEDFFVPLCLGFALGTAFGIVLALLLSDEKANAAMMWHDGGY